MIDGLIACTFAARNHNCEDICKGVSALENILDTIVELSLSTLYKLENLK